ncbi:hypothetical protein ACTFIZ_001405 [Dictyostelium cf. discoideum]
MNNLFFKVWRNLVINYNIFRYVYLYKENRNLIVYNPHMFKKNIEIDYAFKLIIISEFTISIIITNYNSVYIIDLKKTKIKNYLINSDKIETIILPETANLKLIKNLPNSTKTLTFSISLENNGTEYFKNRKLKIFPKNNAIEKIELYLNTGMNFRPVLKKNLFPPKLKELKIGSSNISHFEMIQYRKNSFPNSLEKLIIVTPLSYSFKLNVFYKTNITYLHFHSIYRNKLKIKRNCLPKCLKVLKISAYKNESFNNSFKFYSNSLPKGLEILTIQTNFCWLEKNNNIINFFPSSLLKLNIYVGNFFKYYKSFHYVPLLLIFNKFIFNNEIEKYKSKNLNNNLILKSIFPDNLIKLNIQWTFENDLLFLPKSLTSLSFLNSDRNVFEIKTAFNTFKQLIETNKLPQTLKKLKLSFKDIYLKIEKDKIDFSNLPKSLEKLYFYDYKEPKTNFCLNHYHEKPKFQYKINQYINSNQNILGINQNQTHINYLEINLFSFIK